MKTYQTQSPRFAIGLAAIALTVATLAVSILAPADLPFHSQQVDVVGYTNDAATLPADATVTTLNVVAVREQRDVVVATKRAIAKRA